MQVKAVYDWGWWALAYAEAVPVQKNTLWDELEWPANQQPDGHTPYLSEKYPKMPAPQRTPTKNIDLANQTFQLSSQINSKSDTMECVLHSTSWHSGPGLTGWLFCGESESSQLLDEPPRRVQPIFYLPVRQIVHVAPTENEPVLKHAVNTITQYATLANQISLNRFMIQGRFNNIRIFQINWCRSCRQTACKAGRSRKSMKNATCRVQSAVFSSRWLSPACPSPHGARGADQFQRPAPDKDVKTASNSPRATPALFPIPRFPADGAHALGDLVSVLAAVDQPRWAVRRLAHQP